MVEAKAASEGRSSDPRVLLEVVALDIDRPDGAALLRGVDLELRAGEIVDRMRVGAKDFDYSKAKAGIEIYRNLSNTALAQAKIAAQRNDMDEYKKQMQIAIESWPLNPGIKEQNELFSSVADVQVTTLNELDMLLSQGNTAEIVRQQFRFAAAAQNDPQRMEQLKRVIEGGMDIQMTMAKIKGLAEAKNPWGAWETVREAREQFGDEVQLLKLSEELSEDVASFISVLKKAERLEEQNQAGLSLTWYLKAKRLYPQSSFARKGIDRLVEDILPGTASVAVDTPPDTAADEPAPLTFE